MMIDLVALIN